MRKTLFSSIGLIGLTATQAAKALTIAAAIGGAPTGVKHLNFDDLTNGSSGALSTTGPDGPPAVQVDLAPNARVATGSVGGEFAAPFISGNNGQGFASQVAAGVDTTPYLTSGRVGDGGSIKITFANDQQYLGLLWGSVDDYNTLEFFDVSNNLIGTVTGTDVVLSPNGDQGVNGTLYVNIDSATPFRYVVASSTQFAFELDNVAYNEKQVGVPEGGSLGGVLGLTIAGMFVAARRKLKS